MKSPHEIKYPALIDDKGSLTAFEKQLLGNFMILSGAKVILELGVFKGVTTKFICSFLESNNIEGKVYGFDIPEVVEVLEKDAELKAFIEKGLLVLVPGRLPHSLKKWLHDFKHLSIDFVLDDALHDYPSVYGELKLIWPHLSSSGYVLCHDYGNVFPGVVYAVDKFATKYKARMIPLLPSLNTKEMGLGSALVALRKKEFKWSFKQTLKQELFVVKIALARSVLWKKILRPFFR